MFVALKNWRERLKHRGGDSGDGLLAGVERALGAGAHGSGDLLRQFRAAALAPVLLGDRSPSLAELGAEFVDAEPLSTEQNLSIMDSVERGAARQTRRRR